MSKCAPAVYAALASVLLVAPAPAQAPAIQQYDPNTNLGMGWGGDGIGPGFYFSTIQSGLLVTSLSYFNPAITGGASGFSYPLAGGGLGLWLYALAALPTPHTPVITGTILATATINNSSPTRTVTSGAPGAFFAAVLANPVLLMPNTVYGVFGGTLQNGSIAAVYADGLNYLPTTDPRISFLGSGTRWGPVGASWTLFEMNGLWQHTGASFDISSPQVVPEPGTLVLVATGLAGIGGMLRRRRQLTRRQR